MELLESPDPSIPLSKDVKKCVRKLSRLEVLEWSGPQGKGTWHFAKARTSSGQEKRFGLISVEFEHAALRYEDAWRQITGRPYPVWNLSEQDQQVSDLAASGSSDATLSPRTPLSVFSSRSPIGMQKDTLSEDDLSMSPLQLCSTGLADSNLEADEARDGVLNVHATSPIKSRHRSRRSTDTPHLVTPPRHHVAKQRSMSQVLSSHAHDAAKGSLLSKPTDKSTMNGRRLFVG